MRGCAPKPLGDELNPQNMLAIPHSNNASPSRVNGHRRNRPLPDNAQYAGVWGAGDGGGGVNGDNNVGTSLHVSQHVGHSGNGSSHMSSSGGVDSGKEETTDETRRVVISTVDHEQLARRIRVARFHLLGGYTHVDGALIWIIHALVSTSIVLFLVQTDVLPMEWDLRPFFRESRVFGSNVVTGGFFFAFAPMGIVTGVCGS